MPEVELRVVAAPGSLKGCRIAVTQDRELTPVQRGGALTGAVGHAHGEPGRIVIEDREDERRARLRAWRDVVGNVAPDDLASGGLGPLQHRRVGSTSKRLERTERFLPCGACLLICRNWPAVSGPSSGAY